MTMFHPNPTLLGPDGRPLSADDPFQVNVHDQDFHGEHLHEDDFHEDDDPLFDAPPGGSGDCPGEAGIGPVPPNAVNHILRGSGYAFTSLRFLLYFSCKSYLFGSCFDDFGHAHRRLLFLSSWIVATGFALALIGVDH